MCLSDRKPSGRRFSFRDQDTGNPLDMAPKIWMWEVPMMPKDPTSAQGIHNQNAIDHVYLQGHNYPELHARSKGEAMDKQRLQQIEEYSLGFFQRRQHSRLLAKELFDSSIEYANADLV